MIMAYIGILLVFIGIILTLPFIKNNSIRTFGWGLHAVGWFFIFIYSFICGKILLAVIDFVFLILAITLCITSYKETDGYNN